MSGRSPRIALVGAGRVGQSMAAHALAHGAELCWVLDAAPRGDTAALQAPWYHAVAEIPRVDVDLCIIAVPDAAIKGTARTLAERGVFEVGTMVFHTSGIRTSEDVQALCETGMITGGLHPVQSFSPLPTLTSLRGITCGIEGGDVFEREALALATGWGWHGIRIDAAHKALYHAACVLTGNFPTVLAEVAGEALSVASKDGLAAPWQAFLPMLHEVLRKLEAAPPAEVLTGPARRGDADTLRRHADALRELSPEAAHVYDALSALILSRNPRTS